MSLGLLAPRTTPSLRLTATGAPIPIYLPGDSSQGRNAMGMMILLGQPGSGKTELQLFLAAEVRSRYDAEVVYIDGRKGLQLPKEFRDAMHVMITNADDGALAGLKSEGRCQRR